MSNRLVVPFRALDQDGRTATWADLAEGQALVLVFIKKDCPCSVEFEPYFHRVFEAYRSRVRFAGVIDGPPDVARRYVDANHVPYPVLADAELRLIAEVGAENGAYVALLTPNGVLDTVYPGCSVEMMQELSRRIAALSGVEAVPIDATGMPEVLLTGCPYSS
jgi:peroxiredoxin